MSLGNKINEIRKRKGLSIDDLCELSGIPKGTMSKITAGITTSPTLDTVRAIANALECKLDDLDDSPRTKNSPSTSESVPGEKQLISLYRELNDEGREKLVDYADDLVSSGKYIKSNSDKLGGKKMA